MRELIGKIVGGGIFTPKKWGENEILAEYAIGRV